MEPEGKKRDTTFIVLFTLTVISGLFWLIGLNANVYAIAAVGAIFEILWLPVVLSCIVVPIVCCAIWIKRRFPLKSKYLWLMLTSAAITTYVIASTNG